MAQGRLNAIQTLTATIGFDVYTKAEADAKFATKESVYTKQETDALLDGKADKATTLSGYGITDAYTKTESNSLLDAKADKSNTYTKTETDNLLNGKADKSTTLAGYGITDAYTKTQTDNLLNGKADADSVYTKSEIDTKIPNSVGSTTKPVYVNGGVVSACTYELNKTVPANAVFTDTTYTAGNGLNLSGTSFSAKAGTNVTVNTSGINVNGNGAVASADSGLISGGTAYTELRPTLDGTWVKNAQTTAINLQKLEGGIEYLYGLLSHQYDQLKKYINGNYYDYDTDSTSAYTKSVPAGAMPYASLDSIGGKTLVWNQLCDFGTITTANNYAFHSGVSIVSGHKYYVKADITTSTNAYFKIYTRVSGTNTTVQNVYNEEKIFTSSYSATSDGTTTATDGNLWMLISSATNFQSGDSATNIMLIDLTLLYGAGNEPTTVAEFQQQFPADYYAFNNGTLLSAGVTEVKSVGKNLLNTQRTVEVLLEYTSNTTKRNLAENQVWKGMGYSGYTSSNVTSYSLNNGSITYKSTKNGYGMGFPIKVKPSTTYRFHCTKGNTSGMFFLQYNAEGYLASNVYNNFSSDSIGVTTTATTSWLMVGFAVFNGSINTDITINDIMVEEASADSTYTPYRENTYPIPAEIQALEGYGWSAGSVYNYIDYERKVFVQRVAKVDLGTFSWTRDDTSYSYAFFNSGSLNTKKAGSVNMVTENYVASSGGRNTLTTDKMIAPYNISNSKAICVRDDIYSDSATFASAVNGKYLYYELETPIETDISAYITDDNLIEVEAGGSLTFPNQHGDDYRIDVPSAETYMVDLQSAL